MSTRKLLQGVLETVDKGAAVINAMGVIEMFNRRFSDGFQLPTEDIAGRSIYGLMGKADFSSGDLLQLFDKNVLIERENINIDSQQYHEIVYLSCLEEGKDIGEKVLEFEIYKKVLMAVEDGIQIVDAKGRFIFCNAIHAEMDGFNSEDMVGKYLLDLYSQEQSPLLTCLKTGKTLNNVYCEYTTQSGKKNAAVVTVFPLYKDNELLGAASIVKDYTSFKLMLEKSLELMTTIGSRADYPGKKQDEKRGPFDKIVGVNRQLVECVALAEKAANIESPVFIFGETGTGKEIFAQSIHAKSNRAGKPFLAINCAAIPENLLEGLLFGTIKGVFTGAENAKGLFEQANGGTFFLDELNSMSLNLQSKLLRVLEEKKVRRLGDKVEIPIDVRLIASCNVDPYESIRQGSLRNDIFYRLAVIYIAIPPLRDRLDDLERLTAHFVSYYNHLLNKKVVGVSGQVLELFKNNVWPGNVRQLKYCIESAMSCIPEDERLIKISDLPQHIQKNVLPEAVDRGPVCSQNENTIFIARRTRKEVDYFEREKIIQLLRENNGNITKVSGALGMSRQSLQYRIKKYNIRIIVGENPQ